MFRTILLFSLAHLISGEDAESAKLMGVETEHDPGDQINKNTIITRNLKIQHRVKGKQAYVPKYKEEPDWSYDAIPHEMSSYVADFKRNMSECLREVQASDTRPVKRLSPRTDSPVHGECLIACVLKRNGVIEKGKVNKANLLSLVNKFFSKDTKLMKKLEKQVDSCIAMSARHDDECDLAAKLNSCTNDLMAYHKRKLTVSY